MLGHRPLQGTQWGRSIPALKRRAESRCPSGARYWLYIYDGRAERMALSLHLGLSRNRDRVGSVPICCGAHILLKSCPGGAKGFSPACQRRGAYHLGFALKGPGETVFSPGSTQGLLAIVPHVNARYRLEAILL